MSFDIPKGALAALPAPLDATDVARIVRDALQEDLGNGDITSNAIIPEDLIFCGELRAREAMVVAGLPIAELFFRTLDPNMTWQAHVQDGTRVEAGSVLAVINGSARAMLSAERPALNTLQHLSGIATLSAAFVDAVKGTHAVILDTRKTTPGLRTLEKYATTQGGVTNHRMRLDDAVLIKDNHIAVATGLANAVGLVKAAGHTPIEVECDTLAQVEEALAAGVDAILLDNMDIPTLRSAMALIDGRVRAEASGGVNLQTVRSIAETGVDNISVGRITQSAPAVDIGLDWRKGE